MDDSTQIIYTKNRYFGLKLLINHGVDATQNELLPVFATLRIDVISNPFAVLLCYYASVIFLRDIHKKRETENAAPNMHIHLEPLNGQCLVVKFYVLKTIWIKYLMKHLGELNATHIEDIKSFVKRICRFVCRHSNIVSNLMMMVTFSWTYLWFTIIFQSTYHEFIYRSGV